MERIITINNLRNFAYCNNAICATPIRSIVLDFFGLGGQAMYGEDTDSGRFFADRGVLYVLPYYNPWSWMNQQTVDYVDELVEVLFAAYGLPEDTPIASTGGSMGGLAALVYTAYAHRTPSVCVANCPVCDLPFHFTERPDLPRTLYSAFGTYPGTLKEALCSASPLHLAEKMPAATHYHLFHCEQDGAVNKVQHSDRFVAAMTPGHTVAYYAIPDRGHCDLPPEVWEQYNACILQGLGL